MPAEHRGLLERDTHPVASLPDDLAPQLQPIIWHEQVEGLCNWNDLDHVGKFDGCAGTGKVANRDAAVLSDGSLTNFETTGNPSGWNLTLGARV